jgi:hypothetical protein
LIALADVGVDEAESLLPRAAMNPTAAVRPIVTAMI